MGSQRDYGTCGREQEAEIYARSLTTVNELEAAFGALWTQCQRCQGSLHQVQSHYSPICVASMLTLPGSDAFMCPHAEWQPCEASSVCCVMAAVRTVSIMKGLLCAVLPCTLNCYCLDDVC